VVQPLRITAGDLLGGIERRQRGLDLSQEHIREKIAKLLREDWFAAIEACEALLEETAATLRELNDILLKDTATLQSLLQDIGEVAREASAVEASRATQQLADQVDRVAAWGASRQRAWSDYYRYVQRFLRDVVRLDPGRALSQRLRDQLRTFLPEAEPGEQTGGHFAFIAAAPIPLPLLRVPDMRAERPPVTRPVGSHDQPLAEVVADVAPLEIEAKARELLAKRPAGLSDIIREIVGLLPEPDRYRTVGRITSICAVDTRIGHDHERPWVPVDEIGQVGERHSLVVEEWRFNWDKPVKKRKERS